MNILQALLNSTTIQVTVSRQEVTLLIDTDYNSELNDAEGRTLKEKNCNVHWNISRKSTVQLRTLLNGFRVRQSQLMARAVKHREKTDIPSRQGTCQLPAEWMNQVKK